MKEKTVQVLKPFKSAAKAVLTRVSFTLTRTINGKSVRVPIIGWQGRENLTSYEPMLGEFISLLLDKQAGTFVDVGVNLGQILLKVKSHQADRKYIGFEISSFCHYYSEKLVEINGFTDCTIIPLGLTDTNKFATFYFTGEADAQGTTVDGFWEQDQKRARVQRVFLIAGDTALSPLNEQIGIVKIDVEGAELEVLKGLSSVVTKDRPLIVTEVLPHLPTADSGDLVRIETMRKRQERSEQLSEVLSAWRYQTYRVRNGPSLEAVDDFGMPEWDAELSNYCFIPAEKIQVLGIPMWK